MATGNVQVYVFGPFQLDPTRRELRRGEEVIKLYPKEFDTLLALVERRGQVVEKDELLRRVWPDATVEEGNLTTHVSHLRKVLSGSTGSRDYIVTVPGRGYQFVASLQEQQAPPAAPARTVPRIAIGIVLAIIAVAFGIGLLVNRRSITAAPAFHQLTFERGTIWSARFAPDGQTIVYGAAWRGRPIQLFSTRPNGPESRPLGLDADVLSVAPSGEMAIAVTRRVTRFWDRTGTLARVSLAGGAPRELLDDVKDADWSPDGASLAVVRRINGRDRLEYPIGTVLKEVQGFFMCPRVSRAGDAVAFLERRNGQESLELVTTGGAHTTLARFENETGLAWSSSRDELLVTVVVGGATEVRAITRSGTQRVITEMPGEWMLFDVSRQGQILMGRNHARGHIAGVAPGETDERDLSWLDRSVAVDLSADGRTLLLSEIGAAGGLQKAVYIRKMDGSPAVKLGDGEALALSPDDRWVIVNRGFAPERLVLLPTGSGQPRPLNNGAITDYYNARWLPDGRHIVFGAIEPGQQMRRYVQDTQGGDPRPASPGEPGPDAVFLPNGSSYVGRGPGRGYSLHDNSRRETLPIPSLTSDDRVIGAASDGRSIFVLRVAGAAVTVDRVDLKTGQRERWRQIVVPDPAGVMHPGPEFPAFLMATDGRAYAYNFLRVLSDLYLVDGLQR
jgi:DNA-binding winged helix-turn-helix (wHTH) protein/Tol biopolymer transport system component